ncbi:MAG: sialidase family protein [Noviherbaspirillum sp.]
MFHDHHRQVRRRLLLAAAATMAGATAPAGAQQGAGHQHGTPAQARKRAELGASAAVDAKGAVWVAYRDSAGAAPFLALQSSSDGGRSWSAPRQLTAESVAAGGESRPKIAFGRDGEILVAYTTPIARPHIGDIRFMRSTDGGRSFSAPTTVHAHREVTTHSFESMIVDQAGRIFIAWVDGRDADAARARGERYAGSGIYYAVSEDGGASFKGDYKIADHSCECCRIGLALNRQGNPVAMWRHVFAPNIRDHALAELAASGAASPLARASFDDWRIDACPHQGPALAYAADGLRHQVWFNGNEEGGGVQYAAVAPGAVRPQPAPLGSAQASQADVAVLGRRVALVWKQFEAGVTAIIARLSDDGGASWRQQELARTAGDSGKPYLVTAPSGILLLWRTDNEGTRVMAAGGKTS